MNPLSHAAHTTLAAPEQLGDNVDPPIANLPDEVFATNIFPYLGSRDLSRAGQVCRRFNVLGRTAWQRRAREICRACAELLTSFGRTPLGPNPSPAEAATFLDRTVQRVREIQNSLPEDLRSQFSTDDLVCKVGPGYMSEFLQTAHNHSLRTVFGELAHVPGGASLGEAVRLIREWLHTAEAGEVQELRLENRGLFCLPGEIGQLTALHKLDLGSNQLASLAPEIGQLTALQTLYLDHNRLSSLPPEIGRLTILQRLRLANNQLASLPPEIGQLTRLQALGLNNNQLTSLPPEIGQLTALHTLYLDCNQLASLPPEVGQLTALKELDLSTNQLASLPPEIEQLTALYRLLVRGNQVISLSPEIWRLTVPW